MGWMPKNGVRALNRKRLVYNNPPNTQGLLEKANGTREVLHWET